jgi:hypothetical protein
MATEKCTRQLPPIRVGETLETALMRLAAADDRSLSEYLRLILERHAFGHARSLMEDNSSVTDIGAMHRNAQDPQGRR